MTKSALFPELDKQDKQLEHIKSLTTVLLLAGGSDELIKADLCSCLSLLNNLAVNVQTLQTAIVDGVIKLGMEVGA
tara:strand:+ start:2132 stop:2359 length:228 start_codon:yes stop_codon:yes gene_type:complete